MAGPWEKYGQAPQQTAGPWQKYGQPAPDATPGAQSSPQAAPEQPGFFQRFGEATGVPTSWQGLKSAISPVMVKGIPTVPKVSGLGMAAGYAGNIYDKAKDLYNNPDVVSGLRAITSLTPFGSSQETFGEDVASKNYKGAAGTATGIAAQVALPEAMERLGKVNTGINQRAQLSKLINDTEGLSKQGKTLNVIDKASQAAFNRVKETLLTLQGKLKADAQKSIQPFLDADKARGEAALYPTQAAANVAKAISETDYSPKPSEQALLDQLSETTQDKIAKQLGYPDAETAKGQVGAIVFDDFVRKGAGGIKAEGLTLDQTLKLRSAIGSAMSRATDPKAIKVLTEAYNGMNDSINGRLNDLQGRTNAVDSSGKPLSNKAFEQYNKNHKAAFQLNDKKSFTSKLMDEPLDHHDARNRLPDFIDANLTEISQQMKDKGMNPKQIYELQKDAKSVLAARDSVMGRYNKSLRGVMAGSPSEAALPLGVYAASRGAGLYGIVPYMLAVMAGRIPKNMKIMSDFAGTLDRLGVSQKAINTRVQPGPFMSVQPESAALPPQSAPPSSPTPSTPPPSSGPPVDTSNFPTPESRAASDLAFQMRYPKGELPGKPMDPIAERAWDESLKGTKPETRDIGSRVRKNEPTRAEVKAAQIKQAKESKSTRP